MGARSGGVLARVVALAFMAGAGGLLVACATPTSDSAKAMVRDVRVDQSADGRVVTLIGLEGASHTSFQTEDPRAVVIDLVDVRVHGNATRIPVYDGLVDQVSLSPFSQENGDVVTRVEVTTSREVDFEVVESADGLAIQLRSPTGSSELAETSTDALDEADPWADSGSPSTLDPWAATEVHSLEASAAELDDSAGAALPAASQASELKDVRVQVLADGVLIHLAANGTIGATERFALTHPDRFVVDMPGLTTPIAGQSFAVDSDRVKQVRVGSHTGKVRIVVDGGPLADGFAGRRIVPSRDGLFVGLGDGPTLAAAISQGVMAAETQARRSLTAMLPPADVIPDDEDALFAGDASPDASSSQEAPIEPTDVAESDADALEVDPWEVAEASDTVEGELGGAEFDTAAVAQAVAVAPAAFETPESVRIYGINYDSQDSLERIAVLSDGVAEYEVHTPDPETLVLSIQNAVISPGAEGRLAAVPGAPISLITTFQQPDIEGDEVRIVVKRAADVTPAVTRRGTMLFIDFPNQGEAAAPPPAFSEAFGEAEPASAASEVAAAQMAIDADPSVADATLGALAQANPVVSPDPQADEAPIDPWQDDLADSAPASGDPATAEAVPALPTLPVLPALATNQDVPAAVSPPAAVQILKEGGLVDGKEYQGRRISLDFNDVPVDDVLRLIAEVSDLNVIAGDEVKGNITIRMMDVPWDQALDIVLLTKGLGFIRIGNVLRIAPSDVLKAEAEVRLQERRNLEKLEDLVVRLQPVNYADVKDASALVQRLLSERGSVIQDDRTSTLIIKDIPSVVDEAVALVVAIDTQTPQVLIEAKIVEANLDFSRELGTVWQIGSQPLVDGFDSSSGPRSDLGGQDFRFYGNNSLAFSNPIKAIPTATGTLSAFLLDEKLNLEVQLQAQESNGEGKVISSPRIVTMDNSEALIEQGVSIPFQTFEQGDAKLEFIDAVLSLKVTPHITADRSIIMKLEVTRNAPDGAVETPTGSPAIAKNVAKTETLVGDGQTLVLGGIYTITKAASYSRVPYLHKIPVIGAAFQSKRLKDERKELLIFVTPRVLANVMDVAAK